MMGWFLLPFVLERADFMRTAGIASSSEDPRGALSRGAAGYSTSPYRCYWLAL